jgi:TonB family protein
MKSFVRIAAGSIAVAVLAPAYAVAQYANEFTAAKLIKQGTTSKPIVGSGTVTVQVQVNADGTHKAIRVINSTNPGDNAAALEIAQNSSYRPAHRGTKPVTAFYDFRLRFNGRSVATNPSETEGVSSGPTTSVASRNQAETLAVAAVKAAQQNPALALADAQKAVALNPSSADAKYALGVAQVANKQYSEAIATLKEAHAIAFADPKTPTNAKVAIDTYLMNAYLQTNDTQAMQATAAEIKQLNPSSTLPARVMGNSLLKAGLDAGNAKNYDQAFKDFDQAAAGGDPEIAVTANVQAAFLVAKMEKPDYKRMQGYADKALALRPNDPQANFAEGISLTGQWAQTHDDGMKKRASDALAKADQQAKAQGDITLSLQIESFVKNNLNATPGSKSGSGN